MKRGLFCFRQDLRLDDHPALSRAVKCTDQLDFVYLFEDKIWSSNDRISHHRARFILESLEVLKSDIEEKGGTLLISQGNIVEAIPRLMKQLGSNICFMQAHSAYNEKLDEVALAKKVNLILEDGATMIHADDFENLNIDFPETFTQFRKQVEKNCQPRHCIPAPKSLNCSRKYSDPIPSLNDLRFKENEMDSRTPFHFQGGGHAARKRVNSWIWKQNCLSTYKETRNGLVGSLFSSRFSPWLAQGCISPRFLHEQVREYEHQKGSNKSTYWMIFELLWRDFFHFFSKAHGKHIFHFKGIHPERTHSTPKTNLKEVFENWKMGQTDDQFVNANMNELRMTGWMSNRGRQNVASYLIHQLGLDWRLGARWFEQQLIDYDPCSNYGNWLYLSGFGSDPRPNRIFNVAKQASIYDANQEYRKLWL